MKLSCPDDRLMAISGIAEAVQKLRAVPETDYPAGLWRSDLPESLLWQSSVSSDNTVLDKYIAPSWSWASTVGPISYLINKWRDGAVFEKSAVVLDAWTNDGLYNNFGPVSSTFLSLAAPVSHIELDLVSREQTWYCEKIHIGKLRV